MVNLLSRFIKYFSQPENQNVYLIMDEVEFTIEFYYNNKEYSGIVRPGKGNDISYVVQYFLEPSREIEKTIEISIFSEADEIDNIQWKEQTVNRGQITTDPELIQIIGEAIEYCDM